MNIHFFCSMWGMADLPLEMMLKKVKDAGYDGVEFGFAKGNIHNRNAFIKLANELELHTIGQQCFAEGTDFISYRKSFRSNLEWLVSFNPMFINSHTGRDFYTFDQNCELIMIAEEISVKAGIDIIHETHRGRFPFSPSQCVAYIEKFPQLKFTADLSHFCVVSESYLEEQYTILKQVQQRSFHIHARVGHPQGAQVADPRLPEWSLALAWHLNWWDDIVNFRRLEGKSTLTITPEFGPQPYMPAIPFTLQPVADQWQINLYIKQLLKSRYTVHYERKN